MCHEDKGKVEQTEGNEMHGTEREDGSSTPHATGRGLNKVLDESIWFPDTVTETTYWQLGKEHLVWGFAKKFLNYRVISLKTRISKEKQTAGLPGWI